MDERKYLRIGQVAKRLNISTMTLYRMLERGEFIHGVYISPRCRRWNVDDVDRWMAAQAKNSKQNF